MPPVTAPVPGEVRLLVDVPDPVFSEGMVGGGLAVDPWPVAEVSDPERPLLTEGPLEVVAPISGRIVKMFPHAFAISGEQGDVLVHLGLETVTLRGEGFEELVCGGDDVDAGQPIIRWDPTAARAEGMNLWVVVCGLGVSTTDVVLADGVTDRVHVDRGDALFTIPDVGSDA